MVEETSRMAYERGISSGYITKMKRAVFAHYCEMWDRYPWARTEGITANEVQHYILRKYKGKKPPPIFEKLFKDSTANHTNKIQAPLREHRVLKNIGSRICKVKKTEAKVDVLSFEVGQKIERKKSKDQIIMELRARIAFLERCSIF